MPLTFIYGRSGSGKSEYIYSKLFSLVDEGKKVYLVVPEQYTHISEKNVLKRIGAISPFAVEVLSFERMCSRVNGELSLQNRMIIDSASKNLLISKILNNSELQFYKNSFQPGFSQLCANIISEFKKHNITSENLKDEICICTNPILKNKLSDILCVYEKYENDMNKSDSEDMLDLLAENIASSDFFSNAVVFFDEFSSFIPKELNIIAKIAAKAENTYISLCTDQIGGDDKFSVFSCVKYNGIPSIVTKSAVVSAAFGSSVVSSSSFASNVPATKV